MQLSSVERYNMVKDVWEPMASMKQCRSAHGVTVYQGRIFALGKKNSSRLGTLVHWPSGARGEYVQSLVDTVQLFDYYD